MGRRWVGLARALTGPVESSIKTDETILGQTQRHRIATSCHLAPLITGTRGSEHLRLDRVRATRVMPGNMVRRRF